jgi:leucyl-tRNA synthetase
VPIIEVPGYGNLAALRACDEFGVKSQKDQELLKQAKDKVYLLGFYEGVLQVGEFTGRKVQEAKNLVRQQMIEKGEAAAYFEPEGLVISRSGDECVVAHCD